jgi:hypothetical protein
VSLAERGVEVRIVPLNAETFDIDYDVLEAHLADGRVRWVACTAASNAIGTMPDLSRVVESALSEISRSVTASTSNGNKRRISASTVGLACGVPMPKRPKRA